MAHTIRIKRRVSDGTAPTTSSLVNGELAFNEVNDILYYRENSADPSSIIKIGGSGAYLTTDTAQNVSGAKTFTTSSLKITGAGSNGQVLAANTDGTISFTSMSANAFSTIAGNTGTTTASGADTLTLTGAGALSVAITSPSGVDTATISVASASTSVVGVVQLSSTINTDTDKAATPSAVNTVKTTADGALQRSGGTMTGAITLAADPTNALHAATKQYVDATATGLDVKASVRAATTGNITLSGTQTIDGVSVVAGNRVLVKDQSTGSQNGIYVVAAGAWTRATDFDSDAKVTPGAFTFVEQGTASADSGWVLTNDGTVTVGTTALTFSQFSGAGQITAGAGLTKNGNIIDVVTANAGRIVVNADNIDLATVTQTDTNGTAGINFVQSITKDAYGRISGRVLADIRGATTSQTGIVQLSSTINTDTDKAATPSAVNTVKTTADGALQRSGGTMTGKITAVASGTSTASILLGAGSADPSAPASGDLWNNTGTIKFYNGSATKTIAFTDSNITGTASNVTGTVLADKGGTGITSYAVGDLVYASASTTLAKLAAVATGNVLISGGSATAPAWGKVGLTTHVDGVLAVSNGGTGANTFTSKGIIYGNGTSALQVTAAGGWDTSNGTGAILSVNSGGTPEWTNTLDGGLYTV
jgi:hypothetical protein